MKLLPCPFCGMNDVKMNDNRNGAYWVSCNDCECQLHTETSIDEAISLWNTCNPIIQQQLSAIKTDRRN